MLSRSYPLFVLSRCQRYCWVVIRWAHLTPFGKAVSGGGSEISSRRWERRASFILLPYVLDFLRRMRQISSFLILHFNVILILVTKSGVWTCRARSHQQGHRGQKGRAERGLGREHVLGAPRGIAQEIVREIVPGILHKRCANQARLFLQW